ncbi:MAG: DUF1700 domain-containing protein [Burkholderiaceae bacterium]|nr:DUF1700 domain-containing protein [Burkholderiaceae bacterium]
MNKQAYLDALHKALAGLAPETVARTMAEYEQRFIDGMAAGRGEQDIAEELGEPRKVAMALRASAHMAAYQQSKTPASWARMAVSFIGLAVFNLFMVVPAMVFASLLTAVYTCAFAFYLSGIAITASGLAGTNELVLDGPLREFVHFGDDERGAQTRVSIGQTGIQVFQDRDSGPPDDDDTGEDDGNETTSGRFIEKAERVANGSVKISTELDNESRVTQTAFGMGMVMLGILLCLLSLVVTKYTIAGIKRYIQMNFSLLKGH